MSRTLLFCILYSMSFVGGARAETPAPVLQDAGAVQFSSGDSAASVVAAPIFTQIERQNILSLLDQAGRHGLRPDRYLTPELTKMIEQSVDDADPAVNAALLDAMVLYARDMSGMRVSARDVGLRAKDWRQTPDAALVKDEISRAPDRLAYLAGLAPATPLYQALQSELDQLVPRLKAGEGGKSIYKFKALKRSIRPGDTHATIPDLRTVLGAALAEGQNPLLYDDALVQIVMEFQRNHGLKDDGIIGPKTIQFFNQTYQQRYQQVIANLERLRWLDPVKPEKYIVVNIPAATLWGIEKGEVKLEMPVIVGRTKRPTAQFKTLVQGVRFNPTWTVPDVVKKEDFLPELRKDASFLATKGVSLWTKDPQTGEQVQIDPLFVDWEKVTEADLPRFRMVQPSGRDNALGVVRVIMPNPYDIYLHDTNTPQYFRHDNRDISSGCVRLSRPRDMARFVLSGETGWNDDRMFKVIEAEKTRDVMLTNRFPVLMLYQTAWLKKGGQLVLAYDIYQEDIKLYQALARLNAVPKFSK